MTSRRNPGDFNPQVSVFREDGSIDPDKLRENTVSLPRVSVTCNPLPRGSVTCNPLPKGIITSNGKIDEDKFQAFLQSQLEATAARQEEALRGGSKHADTSKQDACGNCKCGRPLQVADGGTCPSCRTADDAFQHKLKSAGLWIGAALAAYLARDAFSDSWSHGGSDDEEEDDE